MKKIRIGNTFDVVWRIYKAESGVTVPYDLTDKVLSIYMKTPLAESISVKDFSINGNVISFKFEGKDQKNLGVYTLTLIENENVVSQYVVDECKAFQLVSHSCQLDNENESGNISIDSVELQSEMDIGSANGGGSNVDLTSYLTKKEASETYQVRGDYATTEELSNKQDSLIAGNGISIDNNNTISCTLDTTLYKVVTKLPEVGEEHKIYLIESSVQGEQNIYTEYGYINGAWEELGQYRAKIDLEHYALKADIPTKTSQLENDSNFATKSDIPATETYVLNFTIKDGVNTGAFDATEYANLRAAIEAGKLIIIGGAVTRVTADSQAMASDYVVIRYATPRIGDNNSTVTLSVYELKFSATEYTSKAIHKSIA